MIIKGHRLVCRLGFGVVTALIGAAVLAGQASPPQRFEVVSVKPQGPAANAGLGGRGGSGGFTSCSGGPAQIDSKRFALTNTNLYTLITLAYGMGPCIFVHSERISGGPTWMKSDHFDIQAVIPDGSPKYTLGEFDNGLAPVLETMLHNVLVDRFKLAVHRETREMSVYTLNVGKDGFKLQPFKESCINLDLNNLPPPPQPGEKPSPVCGSRGIAGGGSNLILDARAVNLDQLAQFLGGFVLDRPVINRTGIAGLFEMQVHFSPEGTVLPPLPMFGNPAALEPAASIFTAMQEQVGLQLQSTKGPVEVLVIDSVSKPTEN